MLFCSFLPCQVVLICLAIAKTNNKPRWHQKKKATSPKVYLVDHLPVTTSRVDYIITPAMPACTVVMALHGKES
jgi:hypothetical protein